MTMKTRYTTQKSSPTGSALMLVLIMSAIALAILAGVMSWSASSNLLTHRSIQYTRSIAAAEAATEKVESQITRDFLSGGENLVSQNLDNYRQNTVPSSSDSSYWNTWEFNDGNGNLSQTYVQRVPGTSYTVLDAPYNGLKGYVSTYTVVSHARDTASFQDVTAGVLQKLQLAGIPIFQFGMYSSGDMEISCGQPFDITGHVHSNGKLYVEPDNSLTFESDVTAVLAVLFQRNPLDTRHAPVGGVVYVQTNSPSFPVAALTLPIGTSNTPEAIREIIEPPPSGEDPNSSLGQLRYYNKCDMVLVVSNTGVSASSGGFNNFSSNELAQFVSTANSFWDAREGKTVLPIDIDIGALKTWSETNSNLRSALIGSNLSSIYVVDNRTLPATSLGAVTGVQWTSTADERAYRGHGTPTLCSRRLQHGLRESGNRQHLHHPAGFAGGRRHNDSVRCLAGREQHQRAKCRSYHRQCRLTDRRRRNDLGTLQRRHGKFSAFSGILGTNHIHLQWFDDQDVPEPLCHQCLGQAECL